MLVPNGGVIEGFHCKYILQYCNNNKKTKKKTKKKHLGYFNHILGCLSCISVTKECYQIVFIECSLRSFFFSWLH